MKSRKELSLKIKSEIQFKCCQLSVSPKTEPSKQVSDFADLQKHAMQWSSWIYLVWQRNSAARLIWSGNYNSNVDEI